MTDSVDNTNTSNRLKRLYDYCPVLIIVFFIVVISLINPKFLVLQNIRNIMLQMVPVGLLAIGTMFVLISGGMDLTAGVGISLGAVIIAGLFKMTGSTVLSITVMIVSLLLMATLNGLLIARVRLNSVIATLIMMTVVSGAVLLITTATGSFVNIEAPFYIFLSRGEILGIPVSFIFLCICMLAGWITLNYTRAGAFIFAIGNNAEAARHAGVKIEFYTFLPYLLSGISMSLATLVIAARVLWISPGLGGTPILLDAIAANVIGAVSVSGGKGSIRGVFLGTVLVAVINNSVNIINIGPEWYDGFKGAVIILMIIINKIFENSEKK